MFKKFLFLKAEEKNEACALEFTSTPIKACTKTPPH
jgi:hypothetical protein